MSERGHRWLRGLAHLTLGAGAMLVVIAFVHVGVPIYFRVRDEPSPAMLARSPADIEQHLGCAPLTFSELLSVAESDGIFVSSVHFRVEADGRGVEELRERCDFEGDGSDTERLTPSYRSRHRVVRVTEREPGRYVGAVDRDDIGRPGRGAGPRLSPPIPWTTATPPH